MSEPLECCICLDEFTQPASLPCGHSFCLGCIGEHWRISGVCQCPVCKALFPTRPRLITDRPLQDGSEQQLRAGEVPCDFCPAKRPAVKSCLVCLASYCAAHLEPHYQREDLGRHLLIGVMKNLEDSVCKLHGKQLDKFCRSDQTCICTLCSQAEHRGHHIISIDREAAKKKVRLKRRRTILEKEIQERLSKVETIRHRAGPRGEHPNEAWAQHKETIQRAEEEISELQRRNAELEQISQTEDNVHFLQRFLHVV